MLTLTIFLPLLFGLAVLFIPDDNPRAVRWAGLAGTTLTLLLIIILWIGYDPSGEPLQWRNTADWIPGIGASYDVAVDGISLTLIALTGLLFCLVTVYVLPHYIRPKAHAFLFLLMETGLLGLFSTQDLLLFYLFFEVGLVPMYFIIGIWGHDARRYAAVKFFLYTRAGSLAMLLSFLGIYLAVDPHTFSIPDLAAAHPFAGRTWAGGLALLGLLLGFGVKLPIVPIHNWLPDAHVEAPTEGSVILAGIQLKMGAYGIIRVMLPILPETVRTFGWVLLVIAVVSLIYGALAALAQTDFKRLVAYTSVNHMAYVLLGAAVWGLTTDPDVRQLALNGATLQIISHGLLTGGMFFMVGILQGKMESRDIGHLGGAMSTIPLYGGLLGVLAFGSLGLPGLSGFIAEFQVIGATVSVSVWAAIFTIIGLVITTGLYLKVIVSVMMGEPPETMRPITDMDGRQLAAVVPLAGFSLLIGILPYFILRIIESGTRLLAGGGI